MLFQAPTLERFAERVIERVLVGADRESILDALTAIRADPRRESTI
jgi:hypothetical protein